MTDQLALDLPITTQATPTPARQHIGTITALDLFAGTGWGVACKRLGIREMGVEIMPEAIATRTANGMATIYHDVWEGLTGNLFVPRYDLLIASPPCQTFSMAGKGAGRAALDEVLEAIAKDAYKDPAQLLEFGEKHDMRTALVLTPLAHVWRDRPRYVVLEQVPTVLPVWEACAVAMRSWGYDVRVQVLNAEQYGVPQTRKRAILVAKLDGKVSMPRPTHSRYYPRNPTHLDPDVAPWVSMAQALGWGMLDAPMHTITAGNHGPTDRWASGGSSVRKQVDAKIGTPAWQDNPDRAEVDARTQYADRIGIEEASALQTYPMQVKHMGSGMVERHGERPGRPADAPAFTIRASAGGTEPGGFRFEEEDGQTRKLTAEEASVLQSYPVELRPDVAAWKWVDAPATTEAGDPRITAREHHFHGEQSKTSLKLEQDEASLLQSFEPPFVWCGTKSKVFLQIGNAVPPLLGQRILEAVLSS